MKINLISFIKLLPDNVHVWISDPGADTREEMSLRMLADHAEDVVASVKPHVYNGLEVELRPTVCKAQ